MGCSAIILWIKLSETLGGFVGIGIGKQGRTNTVVTDTCIYAEEIPGEALEIDLQHVYEAYYIY